MNSSSSIRTGKTADEIAGLGQERFEVIAKTKDAGLFNEAMASMTRSAIPDILSAYDFRDISILMDVGGGVGELIGAVLKKYPTMRGIVFDLPHCAEGARKNLSDAGVARPIRIYRRKLFRTPAIGGRGNHDEERHPRLER